VTVRPAVSWWGGKGEWWAVGGVRGDGAVE
jgi:hypothetical protein